MRAEHESIHEQQMSGSDPLIVQVRTLIYPEGFEARGDGGVKVTLRGPAAWHG